MVSKSTETSKKGLAGNGRHPNSLANLKPFPKGVSGNPGNPIGVPLVTPAIRRFANLSYAEFAKIDPKKLTMAELIAWKAYMDAIDDEGYQAGTKSRETIMDRLDGKVSGDKADTNIEINGGQVVVTTWPGSQAG